MTSIADILEELAGVPTGAFVPAAARVLGTDRSWAAIVASGLDAPEHHSVVLRPSALGQAYVQDLVLVQNGGREVVVRVFDRGVFDAFFAAGRLSPSMERSIGATRVLTGAYRCLDYATREDGSQDGRPPLRNVRYGAGDSHALVAPHFRLILFPQPESVAISIQLQAPPSPSDRRTFSSFDMAPLHAASARIRRQLGAVR
jgi:hypothetical protein